MKKIGLILLLCSPLLSPLARAQNDVAPTYKMEGLAALMSNYVDYGITHTDKDPSLQGQFYFNWGPQFRLGVWGTNTKYPSSDTHFWLKLNADLKIAFSQNADMTIKLTSNHFYKTENRNGSIVGVHLNLFGYGVRYEQHSNFLGTETTASAYSFSKIFPVFGDWKSENILGAMMLTADNLSNYFWVETWLGTKPAAIYYQIGVSYNSSASQFDGAGDLMGMLKASVSF